VLRALHRQGRLDVLSEITPMPPTDPPFEPYFSLAEELDVKQDVHGSGPQLEHPTPIAARPV